MNSPTGTRSAARGLTGVLAALALLATGAQAGPWGVPLGGRAVRAEVSSAGDVDGYLVQAPADSRLDVTLRVLRGSTLTPVLTLSGPDGQDLGATFTSRRRTRVLRGFALPDAGPYEIEVRGADGTAGAYSISARVRGALGGRPARTAFAARETRTVGFAAGAGSRVSFSVSGAGASLPRFVGLESPLGVRVPVPENAVARRGRRLVGRGIVLPVDHPFGRWSLLLEGAGTPAPNVRVAVRVRGGRLPVFRGRLPEAEPALVSVAPVEAGVGTVIEIDGFGLRTDGPRPFRVFFGGVESAEVARVSDTRVTAVFPAGLSGAADVGILNGDGHADVLRAAVQAVPPPRPTSMTPTRGRANGGTVVEISGSDFRAGATVRIAGVLYATQFVDSTLLRLVTPPQPGGAQPLSVVDPTGQERFVPGTFEFVAAPTIARVRPPLVPRLTGQSIRADGTGLMDSQTVLLGGVAPDDVTYTGTTRMDLTVPDLPIGRHDITATDDFGQEARLRDAVSVFDFEAGPALDGTGAAAPSAMALSDFDADGDLDLFLISEGGAQLSATSLLRVLRNDGAAGFVDVTADTVPAVAADDWRGGAITFGDVGADVGQVPPDGWPDLVIGTTDENVLAAGRSRVRVLANRAAPGGGRHFVDRTEVLMPPVDALDDWWAEDLWVGDLDGDGGLDVLATYDGQPNGESPIPGIDRVYYLSGSRVFTFNAGAGTGYGQFVHDTSRFPTITGSRNPEPGVPTCNNGSCFDDYTPFRGTSLAVVDFDMDGHKEVAVATTALIQRGSVASTQIARSVPVPLLPGKRVMEDQTSGSLPSNADPPLTGGIVLAGDVVGSSLPDLVIVASTADPGERAIQIVENRGFGNGWAVRTDDLLPEPSGEERYQADDALLRDVDGDGDLDLVLLTATAPGSGARGLRILRNLGATGFDRALEMLLPAPAGEAHVGTVLVAGDLDDDGGETILLARPDAAGTGTQVRSVSRTIGD